MSLSVAAANWLPVNTIEAQSLRAKKHVTHLTDLLLKPASDSPGTLHQKGGAANMTELFAAGTLC